MVWCLIKHKDNFSLIQVDIIANFLLYLGMQELEDQASCILG